MGKHRGFQRGVGARDAILKDLRMKKLNNILKRAFLFLTLMFCTAWSFGQSKTSFGSGNAAQCFILSGNASSLSDTRVCTDAIRHDKLSKRDLAATHTNRGIILAAGGKLLQALEDHNQALRLKGDLSKIYINRGTVFHRLKKYEKALIDYQRALELGEVPVDIVQYNKALSLQKLEKHTEALIALEIALSHNPNSVRVREKIKTISSLVTRQKQ